MSCGADWPQWRRDAGRTAASPEELPGKLRLRWTRELPRPVPAWPGEARQQVDVTYHPVLTGKSLFVPSMVTDSVTALDTDTGTARWRFYADGPVRFAPAAWEDRVFFGSDDGYLYCVGAGDGALAWKFRGGPSGRKVIGHERVVSCWPVSGGPVAADGTVYFAAGIWPSTATAFSFRTGGLSPPASTGAPGSSSTSTSPGTGSFSS